MSVAYSIRPTCLHAFGRESRLVLSAYAGLGKDVYRITVTGKYGHKENAYSVIALPFVLCGIPCLTIFLRFIGVIILVAVTLGISSLEVIKITRQI